MQSPNRAATLSRNLLIGLLPLLIFGYYPLWQLGTVAHAHIDLSFLYIAAGVTVLGSLPFLWRHRQVVGSSLPLLLLFGFVSYQFMSLLWTANLTRGIFTASFSFFVILLATLAALHYPVLLRKAVLMRRILIAAVSLVIIWSLWQVFGEALGAASSLTLLPDMYASHVFGIARPTGFALEPQFLGSLLLVPLLWLVHCQLTRPTIYSFTAITALTTVLLLTLSRGALFAFTIGALILLITTRPSWRRYIHVAGGVILSMLFFTSLVVSAATLNTRDSISGLESLSRVTSHLSFGIIELSIHSPLQSTTAEDSAPKEASDANSSGYVASSTDSRLSMSALAISLWSASPERALFGIGSGGFGTVARESDPLYSPSSIVNNTYLEYLVELGVVGLLLFFAAIGLLVYQLIRKQTWLALAILGSILVQWCFFSGNANIIHVWIIIGSLVGVNLYQRKTT